MRFAVCSDEPHAVHQLVVELLKSRGHEVAAFGSVQTGQETPWADVARQAAESIAQGDCDEGVFFCWTGTGISMAANKIPGIRAALCTDVETARGARIWNHANVLALSNRLTSEAMAREILNAWLDTPRGDPRGAEGVAAIKRTEADYSKQ
ncbi:MAG: RpiB/LacA/LacB family sugar-phosphate isomerase [Myxococcota bacterium]